MDTLSYQPLARNLMGGDRHSHKKHLLNNSVDDYPHATKRRLIDKIADLRLSSGSVHRHNHLVNIFGSVGSNNPNIPDYDSYNSNPDKVVIKDIDQFLRDNSNGDGDTNSIESIGKPITDVENVDLEKLVIPELKENSHIREFISKMLVLSRGSADRDTIFRNEKEERLYYYKIYLEKYMAVIPYINPQILLWNVYLRWVTGNKHNSTGHIVELDGDGDEEMIDEEMIDDNESCESCEYDASLPNNNVSMPNIRMKSNEINEYINIAAHKFDGGSIQEYIPTESDDEMSID